RARSEALCRRAQAALTAGQVGQARQWARQAWKKGKTSSAALLMGAQRPPRQAIPYFRFAVEKMPAEMKPRLLLAMACHAAGKEAEGLVQLQVARGLCRSLNAAEDFCAAAWQMGDGGARVALDMTLERLDEAPASVDDLRLKYLCLMHLGQREDARRTLETLLDIDPDDAAGLWYRRHPQDDRLYEGRRVLPGVMRFQLSAVPQRLNYGPLNRLLHWLVMSLRDCVSAADIYRLATPIWRRMSRAEKRQCDGQALHYPLCLALYILIATGQREKADELYRAAPAKQRVRRTLARYVQWMNGAAGPSPHAD
ncbi:MAG: hypothetical protein IJ662_11790, partial [Clostridia bacterium]|nr:hypothetical protein [Clostridia bacterium]